ncbi:helix-turn-helix domain-containing protein [Tabrizicola sp.]|uniref:helix-turn-helix domain-containing protein n=1 Tax=Tabrizicola sp. TaxID=2005166 RepID=UPI0035AEBC02
MLNANIRAIRLQAGLSLDKAALRTGLSKSDLSRLENGHSPITATKLETIAAAYGVRAGDLFEGQIVPVQDDMNLDHLGQVVEMVERIIIALDTRPRPEKVRKAVVETMRLSRQDALRTADAEFDPTRYTGMVKAIFED